MPKQVYDVIVTGTGAGGGMAIKTLCEAGLKVCALNAGRRLNPEKGFDDPERTAATCWCILLDGHVARTDVHPASQILAIEELSPLTGVGDCGSPMLLSETRPAQMLPSHKSSPASSYSQLSVPNEKAGGRMLLVGLSLVLIGASGTVAVFQGRDLNWQNFKEKES